MRTLTSPTHDALSGLLSTVRVRSSVWCVSDFRAPWGFSVVARDLPTFHLVLEGRCVLDVADAGVRHELAPGDLVVLPHGHSHDVRDAPGSPIVVLDDLLAETPPVDGRLRRGGAGARTELLCGGFVLEGASTNPVLPALPPVVHVPGDESGDWVTAALALVRRELAAPEPGSAAVVERITDVLITSALRSVLRGRDALRDPVVAAAVRLLQQEPDRRWTLDELGRSVAVSRSTLVERFRDATGESPMRYLARVRLTLAAQELASGTASLFEIARRCGYESESSLSRAFKRAFGVSPGRYRSESASSSMVPPAIV
jgi:AraC-like DNA-binding protein